MAKVGIGTRGMRQDVERFVRHGAQRLGAPLEARNDHARLPISHLPKPLQERLEGAGLPGV